MTQAIEVPEAVYRELLLLAKEKGVTVDELITDAVSLKAAVDQAQKAGGRLLVERKGHVQELVRG